MNPASPQPVADLPHDARTRSLELTAAGTGHHVQFYDDEHFLAAAAAEFLAAGLSVGQAVIIIATETHRDTFIRRLVDEGIDVAAASRDGLLVMLDARETLDVFMVGAVPDAERFKAAIGAIIEERSGGSDRSVVRMYGEMVDLLWREGNTDGALRLEELWNELLETRPVSLLCAYAMGNFYKASDAQRFQQICRHHTHVVPTERYTRGDDDARLREVSVLQQRAVALEAEIAHRSELEERLRQRERELERLLAEREALLEGERSARTYAEAASRAKSDFLAMMSHELRTPLNAIGGHVQLITMGIHGPVSDGQREALTRIEHSQRHLLSLINDVLNLARIERGQVDYSLACLSLPPLVAETVSMLAPLLAAGRLTCEVVPRPNGNVAPFAVRADREKTQQIVLNVLSNAIKFTPVGGCITVELAHDAEMPDAVALRVADTGVGIPADDLERVFEPFVQLGRSPSSRHGGVGLGLAISRDLARGMGGDLTATSVAGTGTTFTLVLPRADGIAGGA